MWIPTPYRHLGKVDITPLAHYLAALEKSEWIRDEHLRQSLAFYRETTSIFLKSIDSAAFESILQDRPLATDDINCNPDRTELEALVAPVVDQVIQALDCDGLVTRIQLAKMAPGSQIRTHVDKSPMLIAAHRVHVPIVTNTSVSFTIGDQQLQFGAGQIVELNNRVPHSVINQGPDDRIHLIVDVLPDSANQPSTLAPGHERQRMQGYANSRSAPAAPRTAETLPMVIATSVVRGAHKSQSHGGVYLVDLQEETFEQVIDWNTMDISWEGRGWDRGLRGVVVYGEHVYIAASDELFCFDRSFNIVDSWKNPYLRHAHEMCVQDDRLYIASTGFDSVLAFDLDKKTFVFAWLIRAHQDNLQLQTYDPNGNGPAAGNSLHINNVFSDATGLYVSGRGLPFFGRISDDGLRGVARIPNGTHNVMRYRQGVLFNDTNSDHLAYESSDTFCYLPVPTYAPEELHHTELGDDKLARQGFGRGLCVYKDLVISGSSPSTISVWDIDARSALKSVNLSMDIRNAIHGLALWKE